MASFMVRVELHGADWQDYDKLHEAMEEAGFSRTITANNGRSFHLPDAEYEWDGVSTCEHVMRLAHDAAAQTRKKFGVVVTETSNLLMWGLTPVS